MRNRIKFKIRSLPKNVFLGLKLIFFSPGFDYAAGISIVMGGVRLFDQVEDEGL